MRPEADSFLSIEHHPIPALDPTDQRPFWDRPWIQPELSKALFDGPKRTYAVIDAAKRAKLLGGFDIDVLETSAKTMCLYTGTAAKEMAKVAPYLVDLTPFGRDGAEIPPPLRDLFSIQWQEGAFTVFRTDATLESLHKHLRHFLRIRSSEDDDNWTFFRFWDPLTARVYFPGIAARPDRVDRYFRLSPSITVEMVVPDGDAALHLFPRDPRGQVQNRAPVVFDTHDHALMQQVVDLAFKAEMADWLLNGYPARFDTFDTPQIDKAVSHIIAEGARYGFTLKEDYAYLGHMMLTLGGWFAQTRYPASLHAILTDGLGSFKNRLSRAFVPAYQDSPQAALMTAWDDVKIHLNTLPTSEQITPRQFGDFTARFLNAHAEDATALLAETKRDLTDLNLSMADQGKLLVLTLIYGHRFYADPLRNWADRPVDEVIAAVWDDMLAEKK